MFIETGFLNELRSSSKQAASFLQNSLWPPAYYEGAERDADLALQLVQALEHTKESSGIEFSYGAFVAAPGEAIRGEAEFLVSLAGETVSRVQQVMIQLSEMLKTTNVPRSAAALRALDWGKQEHVDPERVLLGMSPEQLDQALESDGAFWFRKRWSDAEYRTRLEVSAMMAKNLSDVTEWIVDLNEQWALRYYEGRSFSGARLGVVSLRRSPEADLSAQAAAAVQTTNPDEVEGTHSLSEASDTALREVPPVETKKAPEVEKKPAPPQPVTDSQLAEMAREKRREAAARAAERRRLAAARVQEKLKARRAAQAAAEVAASAPADEEPVTAVPHPAPVSRPRSSRRARARRAVRR